MKMETEVIDFGKINVEADKDYKIYKIDNKSFIILNENNFERR